MRVWRARRSCRLTAVHAMRSVVLSRRSFIQGGDERRRDHVQTQRFALTRQENQGELFSLSPWLLRVRAASGCDYHSFTLIRAKTSLGFSLVGGRIYESALEESLEDQRARGGDCVDSDRGARGRRFLQ